MIFEGKVKQITPIVFGEKDGKKWGTRSIILTEQTYEYPSEILVEMFKNGDYLHFLNDDELGFVVGDLVSLEYSTEAREYQGRFYGKNKAFRFTLTGKNSTETTEEEGEDLPF